MAAVAVALDVLGPHMKRERRRLHPKDEKRRKTRSKVLSMKKKVKGLARSEANKKDALKLCLKNVEVAKNQLNEGLRVQLEKLYHLPLESYESQSLEYLHIQADSTMDLWFLVQHLKKYCIVLEQMMKESTHDNEYRESLKETKMQISQVMETLDLSAMVITGKISPKTGYPLLPEQLKAGFSRSRRQNRDYLFVKEYKNFLDIIEEFLKNY